MILLNDALKVVLENSKPSNITEKVKLRESLNRVLAEDVLSDMNMPPFDKTAVDGYACRISDAMEELEVIEVIPAGKIPEKIVGQGQCSKIMTGAMIPNGADCVLMVEETSEIADNRIIFTGKTPKTNICPLGEDIRTGDKVLGKGILIDPQHIAIMASVGCANPLVASKPKVAILTTGDELVEPEATPNSVQIRNSNGHQLVAQVVKAGAEPSYYGIISDTKEATSNAISRALNENDIVILTGGVSMGDFDYVPEVLKSLGVNILFESIAVQPGKPTTFGVSGNKLIFGLPGNPVSSYLQFEILVKPAIKKLMGAKITNPLIHRLPMAKNYIRKKTERLGLVPVALTPDFKVYPVEFHGSAHIFALAHADGYIMIPVGIGEVMEGELVDVRPI